MPAAPAEVAALVAVLTALPARPAVLDTASLRGRVMREASAAHHTTDYTPYIGAVMLAIALIFVWRSFYAMRIPEKAAARIFEPLFRLDRDGDGMGLGLATVRRLVEARRGTVTLHQGDDGGALFRVTLDAAAPAPWRTREQPAVAVATQAEDADQPLSALSRARLT